MPPHEYTPQQALEILLRRLTQTVPNIAVQVRSAITQGKEIEMVFESQTTRKIKKGKGRPHREKVPFSEAEALEVAIQVLRACFVEIPQFVNSANRDFAAVESVKDFMDIETEQVPETDLNLEGEPETVTFKLVSEREIEQQQANIERLAELFHFTLEVR